jgi:hypothetical protein
MNVQHPDSLRSVLDSVFAAPAYKWVQRPDPLAAIKHALAAIRHWFDNLHDNNPVGFRVVVYCLVFVMLAIVTHAAWTFFRTVQSADALPDVARRGFTPRDQAWYHREAERLAAAGRFAEAIQADFLALVLALDARNLLRFHPSKTPGEYAREFGLAPGAREEFRDLVRRLYRYAYARSPCGPTEFVDWRARADPERYASAN